MLQLKIRDIYHNKTLFNALILLASNSLTFTFAIVSGYLVSSSLGPSEFGIYSLITFYILILQNITDFGLNINGVKYVLRNPEKSKKIITNILIIKYGIFLFSLPVLSVVIFFLHNIFHEWLNSSNSSGKNILFLPLFILASLNVLMLSTKSTIDIIQQAKHRNIPRVISDVSGNFIKVIIFIGIYIFTSRSIGLFIVGINATALYMLLSDFILCKDFEFSLKEVDKTLIRNLIKLTKYTAALMIINYMLGEVNKVIVFVTNGDYATGLYSPAQKIFTSLAIVPNTIMIPVYTEFAKKNRNFKYKNKLIILFLVISISITIFTLVFTKQILLVTSGNQYIESTNTLKIVSLSFPFLFLNHLFGYSLIAKNKERNYLYISLVSLLVNIVLGIVLSYRYAQNGAAISLIITEMFVTVSLIINDKELDG